MSNLTKIDGDRIDIEVTTDDVAKRFLQATDLYSMSMLERVRATLDTRANKWINESETWTLAHPDIKGQTPGAVVAHLIEYDIESDGFVTFAQQISQIIANDVESEIAYKQRMTLQAATVSFALVRHLAEKSIMAEIGGSMCDVDVETNGVDIEVDDMNVQVRTTYSKNGNTTDTANAKIKNKNWDNVDVYVVLHATPDETEYGVGVNFIHKNDGEKSAPVKARNAAGW